MNRKVLTGIGVSLLVTASLIAVGAFAFRAGQRDDGASRAVREIVVGDEGAQTVIVSDGWRGGWHGGGGFGFLLFPLIVVGLILLFKSRRGGGNGPWRGRDEYLRDWHRQAHAQDAVAPPTVAPPDPPAGA